MIVPFTQKWSRGKIPLRHDNTSKLNKEIFLLSLTKRRETSGCNPLCSWRFNSWAPRPFRYVLGVKLPLLGKLFSLTPILRVWSEEETRRVNDSLKHSQQRDLLSQKKEKLTNFFVWRSKTATILFPSNKESIGKNISAKQISRDGIFKNTKICFDFFADIDPEISRHFCRFDLVDELL